MVMQFAFLMIWISWDFNIGDINLVYAGAFSHCDVSVALSANNLVESYRTS